MGSQLLYRLGIVSGFVMMIAWLFYALFLYRLLRPVNKSRAMTMVGLVLASVPIYMLNQVNQFGALLSASNQMHEQVKLFLDLHRFGTLAAAIFFGLWLIPLGLLIFKSRFIPRFLGILLMVGSPGYLILFVQAFLFPGSERTVWTNPFLAVTHLSELALLLWLLIRGVDVENGKAVLVNRRLATESEEAGDIRTSHRVRAGTWGGARVSQGTCSAPRRDHCRRTDQGELVGSP